MDDKHNIDSTANKYLKKPSFPKVLSHLIVIGMLFILPEIIMTMSYSGTNRSIHWPVYIKASVYILVFYINYYIIIPRTLTGSKPKVWRFVLYNLLLLTICFIIMHLVLSSGWANSWRRGPKNKPFKQLSEMQIILKWAAFYLRDIVMFVLTIGLAIALKLSEKWIAFEQKRKDLQVEQRRVELTKLKRQINPHFLFNTLNSIYSLIDINKEAARKAVHRLSSMLRYMLYDNPASIPIEKEIDFIDNYIELMRLRYEPSLVKYRKSYTEGHIEIPPLIFLCQVENAFKHADTSADDAVIDISITVGDSFIELTTSNPVKTDSDTRITSPGGVGIANLKRRLVLLYGDKASLYTGIENNLFISRLRINL